jgi:hypothetical protein
MTVRLTVKADDDGAYTVRCTFLDGDDLVIAAARIDSILWTMTDNDGSVVNGRSGVSGVVANPFDLVLGPADLDFSDGAERLITVTVTYDTSLSLEASVILKILDPDAPATFRTATEEDLDVFFDEGEFGEEISYDGFSLIGIIEPHEGQEMGPARTAKIADLYVKEDEVPEPAYRDAVVIGENTWHVIQIPGMADGGVWRLLIEQDVRPRI